MYVRRLTSRVVQVAFIQERSLIEGFLSLRMRLTSLIHALSPIEYKAPQLPPNYMTGDDIILGTDGAPTIIERKPTGVAM